MAKVDVILMVYNQREYVSECIASCLTQTFEDISIRIYDDCSSDGSDVICRAYTEIDPRVTFHRHEKNLGATANSEYGFMESDAPYHLVLHGDDVLLPNFIEETVKGLDENPECTFAYSRYHRIVGDKTTYGLGVFVPTFSGGSVDVLPYLCFTNWILVSFALIRRSSVVKTDFYRRFKGKNYMGHGDHYYFALLSSVGPAYYVDQYLGIYRLHSSNITALDTAGNTFKENAVIAYDNIFSDRDVFDVKIRYLAKINQVGRLLTGVGLAQTALLFIQGHELKNILLPIRFELLQMMCTCLSSFKFDSGYEEEMKFVLEFQGNLDILRKYIDDNVVRAEVCES